MTSTLESLKATRDYVSSNRLLNKHLHKGTLSHFAVEWHEQGNPRSVVPRKDVLGEKDDELNAGDKCQVKVREGTKVVKYDATVLGVGSAREMADLLDDLDEPEESDCPSETEAEMSPVIPVPTTSLTSPPAAKRRRASKTSTSKKSTKKKSTAACRVAENLRITEQLLAGLDDDDNNVDTHQTEGEAAGSGGGLSSQDVGNGEGDSGNSNGEAACSGGGLSSQDVDNGEADSGNSNGEAADSGGGLSFQDVGNGEGDNGNSNDVNESSSTCVPASKSTLYSTPRRPPVSPSPSPFVNLTNLPVTGLGDASTHGNYDCVWLQQWMERQFGKIHRRLDECQEDIAEFRRLLSKKIKSKTRVSKVQFGTEDESLLEQEGASVVPTNNPLDVVCGDPSTSGKHIVLQVPSLAALNQFEQITATAHTSDPAKFALKLLSVFFSDEELAESNCTFAEGRRMLDQNILLGIKYHTMYKFPKGGVEAKWQTIVIKNLNAKCRGCRKRLKDKANKENELDI